MSILVRLFMQELPEAVRTQALQAMIAGPLIHASWADHSGRGCALVVAGCAAVNEKFNAAEWLALTGTETYARLAQMYGVDASVISAAEYEWDETMSQKDRVQFLENCRRELAVLLGANKAEYHSVQVHSIPVASRVVRAQVG
jgi:hypothetical protein